MNVDVTINGAKRSLEIEPDELLLDVLRREGYLGVKSGCRSGNCGVCTVLVHGQAVYSCLYFAAKAHGREVVTIEGVGSSDHLHPIQEALLDRGAVQCGYCTPGVVLSAKALLEENRKPSREDVVQALKGNLCRCTGYKKQVEAILDAAERLRDDVQEP